MTYRKTVWVDNKTPVNAENLNKIEDAIERLSRVSVTAGSLKTVAGQSLIGTGDIRTPSGGVTGAEVEEALGYVPANADKMAWEIWTDDGELEEHAPSDQIGSGLLRADGEYAIGRYNISVPGNILTIGSGTSKDDRRNSIEVKASGEVYIYGVSGYDGTNSGSPESRPVSGSMGTTGPKIWTGTATEYETLTPDPGTLYFITK